MRLLNAIKAERRALRVSEMVDVAGEERTSQGSMSLLKTYLVPRLTMSPAHAEKLKSQFLESLSREAS